MRYCCGIALALAAVSARLGSAHGDAKKPGDAAYHTELADISSSLRSAVFDPPFTPDMKDMKVRIKDIHAPSVTLWISLAREYYTEGGYPNIMRDGELMTYDPLKDLRITVPLNQTIDAVNQDIHIKVEDPILKGGGLSNLQGISAHEYVLTVMQAPEWDLVLRAVAISVTSINGKPIEAFKPGPFDTSSTKSKYFYKIDESTCSGKGGETCKIKVQVTCTDVATGLKVDFKDVSNGEVLEYDMTLSSEKVIMAECFYDNEDWTGGVTKRRYYSIVLNRDFKFGGDVAVNLFPYEGVCDMTLGETGEQGFDCRTLVDEPKLIVHASLAAEGDDLMVRSPGGSEFEVRNGLPIEVAVPESGDLEIELTQGSDTHTYPVRLYRSAECEASLCSDNMVLFAPSDQASEHLCHGSTCDEKVDKPFCCGDRADCSTFLDTNSCPESHILSSFASQLLCEFTACTQEDEGTCCAEKAPCAELDEALCPGDSFLRSDWLEVHCQTDECTEGDTEVCCISSTAQTCSSMPDEYCPEGTGRKIVNSWEIYCHGDGNCDGEDAEHCCVPPANCSTYECPNNLPQRNASQNILCRSEVCNEEDTAACCDVGARCDTMRCRGKHVLRHNAESLWCSGKECTNTDRNTCCTNRGTCGDFEGNCGDEKLVYLADAVICRQDSCTEEEDRSSCCKWRDDCANFPGTCPEGSELWADGLCEKEACTTSATDTGLCCQPPSGARLDGMLTISNLDFDKLNNDNNEKINVASMVVAAITQHLSLDEGKMVAVLSRSLSGGGVYCHFMLDVSGHDKHQVSAIRTKFKDKDPMYTALGTSLGATDKELRVQPDEVPFATFMALADGAVDSTHGGITIPGIAIKADGEDSWTVKMPGGLEMGFPTSQLSNSEKPGKSVKEGTKVNVLCRLGLVADWVEEGLISRDVRNFLPFDDENGTAIGTDGETAQASSLVQTYPRSGVDQWPVLGSLSTVVTAGSVACVLSFVALLYNRRWLQRAPNFDDAVTPEARELLETQA